MRKVTDRRRPRSDRRQPDLVQVRVDRDTGLLAAPGAGGAEDLWFRRGTEPTETAGHNASIPTDFGRAAHGF